MPENEKNISRKRRKRREAVENAVASRGHRAINPSFPGRLESLHARKYSSINRSGKVWLRADDIRYCITRGGKSGLFKYDLTKAIWSISRSGNGKAIFDRQDSNCVYPSNFCINRTLYKPNFVQIVSLAILKRRTILEKKRKNKIKIVL